MTKKRNIRIGLWGGVGSGKATYLTMLYRYLTSSKEWEIEEIHPGFSEIIVDYSHNINKGKFPSRAILLPENYHSVQSLYYKLTPRKKSKIESVTLSFLAAPGEFYESCCFESIPIEENQHKYENAVDYYLQCDGIIILLDPQKAMSNESNYYHRMLGDFFTSCQRHWHESKSQQSSNLLPHYFALCLSKSDKNSSLWNSTKKTNRQLEKQNLLSLGEKVIGANAFSMLQGSCYLDFTQQDNPIKNRCKFYYLSSIGRYFEKEKYQESVFDSPDNSSNDNLDDIEPETPVQNQEDASSRPSANIFPSQENQYSYFENQPNSEIKVPSPDCLEPLNIFAPLEWMINSIPNYSPFLEFRQ